MSFFKPRNNNASATGSSSSANSPFIGVQAKLNIGKSNDKYEKEADSVADKVVNKEGLFGNQPFIAPSPTIQKADEGEKDIQKSEETEQIQEKPIRDTITPLVQTKVEEADVQGQEEEPVQAKAEEEPVQMMEEEEPVQAKAEEEPVQMKEEEEPVQAKAEEEPVQMMEDEADVQAKEEEEPIQTKEEEDTVQTKEDDSEIQQRLDASTESKESEVQKKSTETNPIIETPTIQRKDEEIQEKDEEIQEKEADVQRKEIGTGSDPEEDSVQGSDANHTGDTSNLESNLSSSKGGGSPMNSSTKDQMESGFGTDFSGVNIHTDSNAVQMNQELGSQAFANGSDIYFNEGKYDPGSKDGQHLLAHELTHTVQQGASTQPAAQTSIQKAAAAPEPAEAPATKPTTPLDISHKLNLTDAWSKYLDAQYASGKRKFEVEVKIGTRYSGTIELSKKSGTAKGELAKYEITRGTKKNFLNISGWSFLQPMRDAGIDPVLVLEKFGDEQVTTGFMSVAIKGVAIGNAKGFITKLNENLDKMGFLGLEPIKVTDGFENKFEQGRLIFQVGAMTTVVDGYLEAGGGLGITGDSFTFNVNAKVDVAGLASGELMLARGESGKLSGKLDIEADIANVNAKIMVEYIEGAVTIQGTGKMQSEKFSGEITLLVTDKAKSKQMMNAALGVESMDAEKKQAEAPAAAPIPKAKGNQVLAGWGEVTANITPWLAGVAKVGIDSEGHVTIVGEITVPDDIELMEQRGKKVDLFKVEIRAGYGIPLVGQVFLFASIGMFINAGFGPLVLKNVGFKGTYSTDPDILQEFEITGTLNINAFAVIGLEAEAGVGVTILGHDLKAGVNVTAAAGLQAYAEATPTLEYKEQKGPAGGKVGETRLKGHFEAAAQLFMQLNGSLFYELDSPWWSPAPDGREDFPLGEVQYPIGESMGIGADMDWLVGSPDVPELKFSPVEFDPDKFTADVMGDPPPGKKGKSDEKKPGKWEDKNKPGEKKDKPETKDGKGLKGSDKKKEDLKKLPDQQKYMRSLDEMSKLEKADPKPTLEVVKAKSKKVKSKYGIDSITVKDKKDKAEISVKHKKENNKKNILKVPLMSAAERFKLLKTAMDDLKVRNKKAGGKEGKIEESKAKELISAWKKKHPVVELAKVVDGKTTWDYFIDIGDKQNTEKGLSKSEGNNGEEGADWWNFKEKFVTAKGETHHVLIKGGKENPKIWIASDLTLYETFLSDTKKKVDDQKDALSATAANKGKRDPQMIDVFNVAKKDHKEAFSKSTELREDEKKAVNPEKKEIADLRKELRDLGRASKAIMDGLMAEPGSTEIPVTVHDPVSGLIGGFAKGMTAAPLTIKGEVGNRPNPNLVKTHWQNLVLRKGNKGSFYILGHLLNDNIHGKGVANNLTPLTRSANGLHSGFEKKIKKAVFAGAVLYYHVGVDYGRTGVPTGADVDTEAPKKGWKPGEVTNLKKVVGSEEFVPKQIVITAYNYNHTENRKMTSAEIKALPADQQLKEINAKPIVNEIKKLNEYSVTAGSASDAYAASIDDIQEMLKVGVENDLAEAIYEKVQERNRLNKRLNKVSELGNIPRDHSAAWALAYGGDVKLIKFQTGIEKTPPQNFLEVGGTRYTADKLADLHDFPGELQRMYNEHKFSTVIEIRVEDGVETKGTTSKFGKFVESGAFNEFVRRNR